MDVLALILTMKEEDELAFWNNIDSYFTEIIHLLLKTDSLPKFYAYAAKVVESIKTKIGYEPKSDDCKIKQLLLL